MTSPGHGSRLQHVFVVMTLLLTACRLSDNEFRTLDNWLTCDDCSSGERAAVEAMGWKAISRLEVALIRPAPAREAVMKTKFAQSYDQARINSRVPTLSAQAYVDYRVANYVATYQKRAAESLADIGSLGFLHGWRARRALDQAIADHTGRGYRDDVLGVIQFARATLDGNLFSGQVTPARLTFAEMVTVVAPPGNPFNGDERGVIDDPIFPPDDTPSSVVGDTLKFDVVARVGPHVLTVINPGTGTAREHVGVLVTSSIDQNDRAITHCLLNDTTCMVDSAPPVHVTPNLPFTGFVSLWNTAPAPDRLDFFRINNPAATALPVTARLNWRGSGNPDLVWRRCTPFVAVGNLAGATADTVEQTSVSIPAHACWVLGVSLRPGNADTVFARVRVTTP
jgi:hypothetical protein